MHPLKLVEIKKSFGFLQSSPQILAERGEPIYLIKKVFWWDTLMRTLFQTLVLPHVDYCSQLWAPSRASDLLRLEKIQKNFLRKISEKKSQPPVILGTAGKPQDVLNPAAP